MEQPPSRLLTALLLLRDEGLEIVISNVTEGYISHLNSPAGLESLVVLKSVMDRVELAALDGGRGLVRLFKRKTLEGRALDG